MAHTLARAPSSSILSTLSKLPWTALIILFLLATTLGGVDMQGPIGYVFIVFGLFVLFVEFFKSGDISTAAFLSDLVVSVLSVIVGAALITVMVIEPKYDITFFHWYGAVILVADAILAPFNSFRTAKRNLEFGAMGDG
jgi:hypothetical protein